MANAIHWPGVEAMAKDDEVFHFRLLPELPANAMNFLTLTPEIAFFESLAGLKVI